MDFKTSEVFQVVLEKEKENLQFEIEEKQMHIGSLEKT